MMQPDSLIICQIFGIIQIIKFYCYSKSKSNNKITRHNKEKMDMSLQQYCTALKQRNLYVSLMSGINPTSQTKDRAELNCSTLSTFAALQMRRKAEVLQYKNNATVTIATKKQKYVSLAKGTNQLKSISSRICPDNIYLCRPSTASNVPGPTIKLCYDPSVNLIQPITDSSNKRKSQIPRDSLDRQYNIFPNIDVILNSTYRPVANFVMVEPLSINTTFSFSIPIAMSISATNISGSGNTITIIPQLQYSIYYGDTLVYTPPVQPTISPITITVNSNGPISATSYIQPIITGNIILPTLKQDVYTISMSNTSTTVEPVDSIINQNIQWITNLQAGITDPYYYVSPINCTITNPSTPGPSNGFLYIITPSSLYSPC